MHMKKKITSRHDFTARTRQKIAARAGYRCSRPECRIPTSGPSDESEQSVNLGVAAHIHAASPGGPRYDSSQTENERKHIENAIWLCKRCSELIDQNPSRYPVAMLRAWKIDAETHAYQQMTDGVSRRAPVAPLEHPLDRFHQLLKNPAEWMPGPEDRLYYYHSTASDYVISEGGVVNEDFVEPWTKAFPDSDACSVRVNYLCRNTIVKTAVFVEIDGGRYTVPLPKPVRTGKDRQYMIERSSLEWRTSLILDQYDGNLEELLRLAGVQLIGEDE